MQKPLLVGVFSIFFWENSVSWCQLDSSNVRTFSSESFGPNVGRIPFDFLKVI